MKKISCKIIAIILLLLIIISSVGIGIYVHSTVKKWETNIYPGVTVEGIDLRGKTKEQALQSLKEKYQDKVLKKKVVVVAKGKEYSIDYNKLDARYNTKEAVEQAFNYGKNNNLINKFKMIKEPKAFNISLKFQYKQDSIDGIIKQVQAAVDKQPQNAKLNMISGSNFEVVSEVNGFKLENEKLKKEILEKINGRLENEIIKINAPIKTILPKKTKQALKGVNSLISSYTTTFGSGAVGRNTNIKLSTEAINGTVLMPGEEFSFNGVVGERSVERGYKNAHVIVDNKFVDGMGGGICQTSTTIYNAIIRCNINPTERYSHTIASTYVDIGQDATVSWGGPDYKFVNTLKYPIYIQGYTTNNSVTFNVYSNAELKRFKYEVFTGDKQTIPATTEVQKDSSLPAGTQKVVRGAFPGHKAVVYRKVYDNGVFVKQEVLYRVDIKPVNGLILKSSK